MHKSSLETLLKGVRSGSISISKAIAILKDLPYVDLKYAKIDFHRTLRRGFPEVIFAENKTLSQIEEISRIVLAKKGILLITRADKRVYSHLRKVYPELHYNPQARIIYNKTHKIKRMREYVLVVTAGTGDLSVAEEALITLEVMGCRARTLYDAGVAGLHRILDKREVLKKASVIIVIAGMEGALASVISGLTSRPVIAVPTSVGYGASFRGIAPLLTMLNSCSPGIGVVNIDNGFGAGYLAALIINR